MDGTLGAAALADLAPVDAATRPLDFEDVPPEQVLAGSPRTGLWEIETSAELSIGIWEMTAGSMSDVEADELFLVIAGEGTVTTEDRTIELRAGSLCRLAAGTRTRWDVPERLRKLYVSTSMS